MEPTNFPQRVPDVDLAISVGSVAAGVGDLALVTPHRGTDYEAEAFLPRFECFYSSHRASIARALHLTLRDEDLATEATDEAMTRAFERWPAVAHLDNPSGWVYRVALNWATSVLRRATHRRRHIHELDYVPAPEDGDETLRRAITQLSLDHRAVVVCRYYLEWSDAETAAALGIKPGTARSRLYRALRQLESVLAPHRDDRP